MTVKTIGSYQAKTRLPELLREVQAGYTYTITKHGKPIATLMPVGERPREARVAAVEAMLAFMDAQPPRPDIDRKTMKAFIEDGRL